MPRRLLPLLLVVALTWACAEPPDKEMHQAQGAIDAARAAGADEYAAAELEAARRSLSQAQDAVAQRDYRLALSHALDARESAQQAARTAADEKALARGEAERALAETAAALTQAESRVKSLENVKTAARAIGSAMQTLVEVTAIVQEARAALAGGKYVAARDLMKGQLERISAAITDLDNAATPRRRR